MGAVPRAFAAAHAPACHMISTDNMEHTFFYGIGESLASYRCCLIIKNTLFTTAGRANISAGVATDTFRKFFLPEGKPFLRRQLFQRDCLSRGNQRVMVAADVLSENAPFPHLLRAGSRLLCKRRKRLRQRVYGFNNLVDNWTGGDDGTYRPSQVEALGRARELGFKSEP